MSRYIFKTETQRRRNEASVNLNRRTVKRTLMQRCRHIALTSDRAAYGTPMSLRVSITVILHRRFQQDRLLRK